MDTGACVYFHSDEKKSRKATQKVIALLRQALFEQHSDNNRVVGDYSSFHESEIPVSCLQLQLRDSLFTDSILRKKK